MKKLSAAVILAASALFIAAACGGSAGTQDGGSTTPPMPEASAPLDATMSQPDTAAPEDASPGRDATHPKLKDAARPITDTGYWPPDDVVSGPGFNACNQAPPPGAVQAAAFPTYAGTCPLLVAAAPATEGGAPVQNTILSSGNMRQFLLAVPHDLKKNETLPVFFMWHWLKGSDTDFYSVGDVQAAVDEQRFLAVMPQAKGDVYWEWPFAISDTVARLDEEFSFFDDMLACVAAQFPTANRNCVASVGISAGALFTDQLGSARADHLSSILSLSGGVGGLVRPWGNPTHVLPALVLWGGAMDWCGLDFQTETKNFETALAADGNFVVECEHNCGHSAPPSLPEAGASQYSWIWSFAFDHPFWLAPGESPYLGTGLPADYPTWCAVGIGKATERTGACTNTTCIDSLKL